MYSLNLKLFKYTSCLIHAIKYEVAFSNKTNFLYETKKEKLYFNINFVEIISLT